MKKTEVHLNWEYGNLEHALTQSGYVNILLWSKGMAIVSFDGNDKPTYAKILHFKNLARLQVIDQILINEPLLAGPQPVHTCIWIEKRSMLIPEAFFSNEHAQHWLSTFQFVEQDEAIFSDIVSGAGVYISYPISQVLQKKIHEYFPEALMLSLSKATLKTLPHPQACYQIVLMSNKAVLTLYHQQKIIFHNIVDYQTPEDIVYKMAHYAYEHQLDTNRFEVEVSCLGITPAFFEELKNYFPQIQNGFDEAQQLLFNQIKTL